MISYSPISAGASGRSRTDDLRVTNLLDRYNLLNKIPVTELAELSKLSKPYISQVKSGKRPPSQKLLDILGEQSRQGKSVKNYYKFFMQSRLVKQVSPTTIRYYKVKLGRFIS